MTLVLLSFLWHDIFHPLHGLGYQFWSGIAGCFGLLGVIWAVARKHNCHSRHCWRIGRYEVEGTPYVTCAKHHPQLPNKGPTEQHIHEAHQKSQYL